MSLSPVATSKWNAFAARSPGLAEGFLRQANTERAGDVARLAGLSVPEVQEAARLWAADGMDTAPKTTSASSFFVGAGGAKAKATVQRLGGFKGQVVDGAIGRAIAFIQNFHRNAGWSVAGLAEKEGVMKTDAHTFFRAMPALFVSDLQGEWAAHAQLTDTVAPRCPILVDFHLGNLGTFKAKDGAVWGANDYDQLGKGSPEIDLLRACTSLVLLGRENKVDDQTITKAGRGLFEAYRDELDRLADGGKNPGPFLAKNEVKGVIDDVIADADKKSRHDFLDHLCDGKEGDRRFRRKGSLQEAKPADVLAVTRALDAGRFEVLDVVARSGSGGSSRGLPRFWVLVNDKDSGKERVLELKTCPPAPLPDPSGRTPFAAGPIVQGQALMMNGAMSPFTSAVVVNGKSFLQREIEPEKSSLDISALGGGDLGAVAEAAGRVMARAHGVDQQIASQLKDWARSNGHAGDRLLQFAGDYSKRVVLQFEAFAP